MEEKVFIPNRNNLKLASLINKPENVKKAPFVIILRGFTGYKEETHLQMIAELLEKAGIGSVRSDASGYAESEGTIENDYRLSNSIEDNESVYEYMKTLDWVDANRIGVFGNSMGGIDAVIFLKRHPEVKAAVLVSLPDRMGVSDDLGKAKKLKEWKETGYQERVTSRFGKVRFPYAFIEDATKYDASEIIKEVHCPTLFVWGTTDVNVPASQTKKVFDNANEPKEFLEVEGMTHFYKRDPKILELVSNESLEFLQNHL